MRSTFCIVEDRPAWEPAVKLLLLSLSARAPGVSVNLFYPLAGRVFLKWAEGLPGVRVWTQRLGLPGWDVKPEAALLLIGKGFEEVIWVDSDIVVCDDPLAPFREMSQEEFITTIDTPAAQRNGTAAARARCWGLEVRRDLPFNPNLAVFRATQSHGRLLERWAGLLGSEEYRACQQMEWSERPFHMMGDHDPLAALLCSTEFAEIPVHFLRGGKDVLHGAWGYTVTARMRHLFSGSPTYVHSMGAKPWAHGWGATPWDLRRWLEELLLDLSPYTLYAAKVGQDVGLHEAWMEPHSALSRALRVFGGGAPALAGFPLALLLDTARVAAALPRRGRRAYR